MMDKKMLEVLFLILGLCSITFIRGQPYPNDGEVSDNEEDDQVSDNEEDDQVSDNEEVEYEEESEISDNEGDQNFDPGKKYVILIQF
ncbi:ran GTPase-activating protein 1-like [Planococcus citri]|uniref:ran GTPase-activating protein 1-like n=1 Tax=Planococcus citri TaxID=170843 RepID=UPI0031F7E41E